MKKSVPRLLTHHPYTPSPAVGETRRSRHTSRPIGWAPSPPARGKNPSSSPPTTPTANSAPAPGSPRPPACYFASWPAGMRLIVCKERPHPGAQLRITDIDGLRVTAFVTNTTKGQLADLE